MSRRRADDAVRPGDILLPVADGHLNATGDEFIRGNGSVHIRAGNKQAHALEHQSKGRMDTPPMPTRWMVLWSVT